MQVQRRSPTSCPQAPKVLYGIVYAYRPQSCDMVTLDRPMLTPRGAFPVAVVHIESHTSLAGGVSCCLRKFKDPGSGCLALWLVVFCALMYVYMYVIRAPAKDTSLPRTLTDACFRIPLAYTLTYSTCKEDGNGGALSACAVPQHCRFITFVVSSFFVNPFLNPFVTGRNHKHDSSSSSSTHRNVFTFEPDMVAAVSSVLKLLK